MCTIPINYVLVKDSRWGGYLCLCYVYTLLQAPAAHYLLPLLTHALMLSVQKMLFCICHKTAPRSTVVTCSKKETTA